MGSTCPCQALHVGFLVAIARLCPVITRLLA